MGYVCVLACVIFICVILKKISLFEVGAIDLQSDVSNLRKYAYLAVETTHMLVSTPGHASCAPHQACVHFEVG